MGDRNLTKRTANMKRAKIRDLTVTKADHVKGGSLDRRTVVFLVPPKDLVAK